MFKGWNGAKSEVVGDERVEYVERGIVTERKVKIFLRFMTVGDGCT